LIAATIGFAQEELAHVRRATVGQAQEINPRRKNLAAASDDEGARGRCPELFHPLGERRTEFKAHGIGFAMAHPQDCHVVLMR
jgi:hypothetical protein